MLSVPWAFISTGLGAGLFPAASSSSHQVAAAPPFPVSGVSLGVKCAFGVSFGISASVH